jgi:hypothetical protein
VSPSRLTGLAALSWLAAGSAHAITIDGRLDEPEWRQAQSFSDFRVTEPLTRAPAAHATELLILPLPDALYVGMRAEHPADQRTHGHSPRDAPNMDADPAILAIDFEGQGKTAYEFTVTISGSMRDSIILNQSDLSRDWDADWIARTAEDAHGWSAEWRIPWSTAPEGPVRDGKRTIGVYAARFIKRESVRYAFPAIELLGANFVRDFRRIEIPHYNAPMLDLYPYASATHDMLSGATRGRAGFDLFWKPNGRNQVSAAVNPDFGQVESDDLVVNFSAIETFFEEKRPFFTQGQQLFDLRMSTLGLDASNRLVNTRRIGAAPDAGAEGASDILAAVKYTGISGDHEYGVFGAVERDSSLAQGRSFMVGRWRHVHSDFSLGYLGTATRHPTLGRDAYVHAVDLNWRPTPGLALTGLALLSDIHASAPGGSARGYGGWARLDYQPGGRWQHQLSASWFDRRLDFNDLGYQRRADLAELKTDSQLFIRQYRHGSIADNGYWHLALDHPYTTRGERLVALDEFGHFFQWRSGAGSYLVYVHEWPGFDDLLTRGNGSVRMPPRHNWAVDYQSAIHGRFRFYAAAYAREQGFTSYTRELQLKPKFFVNDDLSLELTLDYFDSPNWLIWLAGRQVGIYRRQELSSNFGVNWYPTSRQELRLRMQWVGLAAQGRQAYDLAADGTPVPAGVVPGDFTVSTLGLQLRYRYEFHPLSDLYVVYSRGGDGSLTDRSETLREQFTRAWNQTDTSLLFVKLRYRI